MTDWIAVIKALPVIMSVIKSTKEGLGWIRQRRGSPQGDKEAAERKVVENEMKHLDEMLRNPKYRFRSIGALSGAIHDKTDDHRITVNLLLQLGARHNIRKGGSDSWWMPDYWEEEKTDRSWKLRKGVEPGRS